MSRICENVCVRQAGQLVEHYEFIGIRPRNEQNELLAITECQDMFIDFIKTNRPDTWRGFDDYLWIEPLELRPVDAVETKATERMFLGAISLDTWASDWLTRLGSKCEVSHAS